ncbi:MAG: hypothetical protein KDD77_09400, partial [Caldilineaceae bacterium]|nr:hypothetical protein [Caldilineaceae bacterium]
YNLAVVVDDIRDGVTEVVRGADLLGFTSVQIVLWRALDAPEPTWMHAPLVLGPADAAGARSKLSKSHGSMHLAAMRDAGWQPADVWRLVLPWIGVPNTDSLGDAIAKFAADGGSAARGFDPQRGPRGPIELDYDQSVACPAPGSVVWRTSA